MAMPEAKPCGSCGEPVYWLRNDNTNKPAPIEVKPSDAGNIVISSISYHIVPLSLRQQARDKGLSLHLNHFVTCPQAKVWKKAGR